MQEDIKKSKQGLKFLISPFFILLAAIMLYFGDWLVFVFHVVALLIHEFCHAIVAKKRGYTLNKIKLQPFGAALSGDIKNIKPRDEVYIALAGPVANLILAALTVATWWIWPISYAYTHDFVYINLYMAMFNLLPIYPLDGGRILLASLSNKFKRQKVYKYIRIIGFVASGLFAALFLTALIASSFNINLAIIAIFFFLATIMPDKYISYQRLYSLGYRSQKLKRGLTVKEVMVSEQTKLLALFNMLNSNYFYRFNVVDSNFKHLFTITELELEEISLKVDLGASIGVIKNKVE